MNHVQKLLHSHLNKDEIALYAAMEKGDDFVWLAKHGYYERKQWGGGFTQKGKVFIEQQNELIDRLAKKTERFWDEGKHKELQRKLMTYQKNLKKGTLFDGLSEEETFAVRYIIKTY